LLQLISIYLYLYCSSFYCYLSHPALHSFPTRRSSDLSWPADYSWDAWRSICTAELVFIGVLLGLSTLGRYRKTKQARAEGPPTPDRKSTRLNSSHVSISYAVFCLKKKKKIKKYQYIFN